MDAMDEIIKEFVVESYENLDQLDRDLLALEDSPDDRSRLGSIFRTIHTIKGTSGFLAFPKLEHVTHVGENLLVKLRDGDMLLNNEITDGLLSMVDAVRTILSQIEICGAEGEADYEDLVSRLEYLKEHHGFSAAAGEEAAPEADAEGDAAAEPAPSMSYFTPTDDSLLEPGQDEFAGLGADESAAAVVPTKATTSRNTSSTESTPVAPARAKATPKKPASVPSEDAAQSTNRAQSNGPARVTESSLNDGNEKGQGVAESTVRLDVSLLDRLMNLVGELVLARNQILQFSRSIEDSSITAASQRLNLITTELQEGVMKTRMQPIRNAWSKLPRVVRDLSVSCGKRVEVVMEGAETELDKTILEAIKDPLTHIVRNAVDHGIEPPEERARLGKLVDGKLWLRAFHEGGQVNIEIADDGRGIDLDRVRDKAVNNGLITVDQAAQMTERELTQLILLPGFSTAPKVTNVSGRGVGMDVVKTNVEKIGGTLEIYSVFGQGTTLRIKIPLTLAIVPALIVTCGSGRFCIPQVSLLELVRLEGERARREIEVIHSVPVYRLRGHLLPLLFLDEELGLRPRRTDEERRATEFANIVVLQAEDRQFGLVVENINDTQEIVVKPLGQHLKSIHAYAGATIMGDGTVALILDVLGIAQQGKVLTEHRDRSVTDRAQRLLEGSADLVSWLLIDPGDGTRAAIRLDSVARLEEFPQTALEHDGQNEVVQYRERILPLIRLNHYSNAGQGFGSEDPASPFPVVVFNYGGHDVGIVVGRIIDIVNQPADAYSSGSADRSTRIIHGKVTHVVDLEELVRTAIPGIFDQWSAA